MTTFVNTNESENALPTFIHNKEAIRKARDSLAEYQMSVVNRLRKASLKTNAMEAKRKSELSIIEPVLRELRRLNLHKKIIDKSDGTTAMSGFDEVIQNPTLLDSESPFKHDLLYIYTMESGQLYKFISTLI